MHNDPWSNARVPDSGDACDIWDYFRNTVGDLSPLAEPYFTTTTARDTALTNWVGAGNTARDGLRCYVQGVGPQQYLSGAWKTQATSSGTLSLIGGWGVYSGYHTPAWYLDANGVVTLSGMVQRTGGNFSLGTGTEFQFATLAASIVPVSTVSPLCYVGLGTSTIGVFPARLGAHGGSTVLSVLGIDSGSGTMSTTNGFINLDGVGWHI